MGRTKRKVEDEEIREVRDVPKGEFVKLVSKTGKVGKRVYRLEDWDQSAMGYWLQAWDDCSAGKYVTRTTRVLVGFTF